MANFAAFLVVCAIIGVWVLLSYLDDEKKG